MIKKNIIFFISAFPVFVFRSNFYVKEVAIPLILLLTLTYLNSKFLNFLDKKNSKQLNLIYMSIILTYGIDNHLGLYNGIIQPNSILLLKYFTVIYWSAIFLIIGIIFTGIDQILFRGKLPFTLRHKHSDHETLKSANELKDLEVISINISPL